MVVNIAVKFREDYLSGLRDTGDTNFITAVLIKGNNSKIVIWRRFQSPDVQQLIAVNKPATFLVAKRYNIIYQKQ